MTFKLGMMTGSGMVSVFNATWTLQSLWTGNTQNDIFGQISPETVTDFFQQFGLPTGFAIIFGLVCVTGAVRWYRDLKSMIELRDAELLKKDGYIRELTNEIKQLTRDSAKYRAKYDVITDRNGGNDETVK